MNKVIYLYTLLSVLQVIPLSAQPQMDLKDCMEYALRHSTQMEIQRADYDDALLQRRDALLQTFTPSVSASTNVTTNFGRALDPETNAYISTTSLSNGYGVHASMILFNGLSGLNRIRVAKAAVRMGLSEEQRLEDEICLAVMESYFQVLFQNEMHSAWQAQVRTGQEHLRLIRRQYELGQKGYADVAQTEADVAEREYQYILSGNRRNEALLDLKSLMLWSSADSLLLDDTPLRLPSAPTLPAAAGSRNELTGFAQTYQPKARIAHGEMEKARYQLRAARGAFAPTLSLQGGWSTSYYTYPGKSDYRAPSFANQFHNNGGEYVMLSLSFPLYDRLSQHANLKRKKNDYRRATAAYRQTLKDIENEVSRALQDCQGAHAAYLQADRRWKAQREAYKLSEQQFRQGLISPVEFQTVANAYLNAQAERTNATLQYRLKHSVVTFYQGISYLKQQD